MWSPPWSSATESSFARMRRLRALLEEREQRLRRLDGETLELNQRHKDVAKRIDDLIAQVVLLESQLGPVAG